MAVSLVLVRYSRLCVLHSSLGLLLQLRQVIVRRSESELSNDASILLRKDQMDEAVKTAPFQVDGLAFQEASKEGTGERTIHGPVGEAQASHCLDVEIFRNLELAVIWQVAQTESLTSQGGSLVRHCQGRWYLKERKSRSEGDLCGRRVDRSFR